MISTLFHNHFQKLFLCKVSSCLRKPIPWWDFQVESGMTRCAVYLFLAAAWPSPSSGWGRASVLQFFPAAIRGRKAPLIHSTWHPGSSWASLSLSWLWPPLLCAVETTHGGQWFFIMFTEGKGNLKGNSPEITKYQTSYSWLKSISKFIPDASYRPSASDLISWGSFTPDFRPAWCLSAGFPCSHFRSSLWSPSPYLLPISNAEFSFCISGALPHCLRGKGWSQLFHRFWWRGSFHPSCEPSSLRNSQLQHLPRNVVDVHAHKSPSTLRRNESPCCTPLPWLPPEKLLYCVWLWIRRCRSRS